MPPRKTTNAVTYTAIACITGIEILAMYNGMNGIALSTSIAAICGLGGFHLGRILRR